MLESRKVYQQLNIDVINVHTCNKFVIEELFEPKMGLKLWLFFGVCGVRRLL